MEVVLAKRKRISGGVIISLSSSCSSSGLCPAPAVSPAARGARRVLQACLVLLVLLLVVLAILSGLVVGRAASGRGCLAHRPTLRHHVHTTVGDSFSALLGYTLIRFLSDTLVVIVQLSLFLLLLSMRRGGCWHEVLARSPNHVGYVVDVSKLLHNRLAIIETMAIHVLGGMLDKNVI